MITSMVRKIVHRVFNNTDKVYSLADTTLNSLFRLASSIVLAKIAGAEVFAQYVLITTGIVIIQSLAQNYFTTPVIHVAGLNKEKINELFRWSGTRLKVAQMILLGILLLVFGVHIIRQDVFIWEYSGFVAATVFLLSVQHVRAERQTHFENKQILFGSILGIACCSCIFVMALIFKFNPLLAYGWALATHYLFVYLLCKKRNVPKHNDLVLESEHGLKSRVQRNGLFMVLGSLMGIFSSRLQPFALATFTSSLAVAQFGAVMTIAGPIRMSSMFLQNLLRPRFALYHNNHDERSLRRLFGFSVGFLMVAGVCGILLGFFAEKWLLNTVFGINESVVVGLLPIAMFYAMLDAITSVQMLAMQVGLNNGVEVTTKLRFLSAIITSVLIIPLCISWGAIGAMLSLLAGEIVYLVVASFLGRITSRCAPS